MYTANTMSSAFEALGMCLPYSSTMANPHDEKPIVGQGVGAGAGRGDQEATSSRATSSPAKAIENAVAVIMATGGSTNAVLHFLAIAHAAEVEWTIDDFERVRQQGAGAVRPEALAASTWRSTCTRPAASRR